MKSQIGNTTTTMTLMDFMVDLKDMSGKKYGKVMLKEVQVNSRFNYNLFSINKPLKDRFHLKGDSNLLYVVQYIYKRRYTLM